MGMAPSSILGLEIGSYEAYCLDQAIWYAGSTIDYRLEQAGHKPAKGEGRNKAARQRVLNKYFGEEQSAGGFADPAALFS